MTDKWDPSIPLHKEIAHGIEVGDGIPEMRKIESARQALIDVGFEIEHEEDLADRDDEVSWYYPLEGDIRKAQTPWDYFTVWRSHWSGKFVTHNGVWLLEKLGFVPAGTTDVGEQLKIAGNALVAGGQTKVCLRNLTYARSNLTGFLAAFHPYDALRQQEALSPCSLLILDLV
jgi:sterol 24-C-methyltransferase